MNVKSNSMSTASKILKSGKKKVVTNKQDLPIAA